MYVCEKCHDRDLDATQCNYTFSVHLTIIGKDDLIERRCEICGKLRECIFCDEYQAEVIKRSGIMQNQQKRITELKEKFEVYL